MDLRRLVLLVVAVSVTLVAPSVVLAEHAGAAEPGDVTVTEADDGQVVHLVVGQRLQVRLTPAQDEVWDVQPSRDAGTGPLYLEALSAGPDATSATYQARRPSTDAVEISGTTDRLCRHERIDCGIASRAWHVQVLVDDAGQADPTPMACPQFARPSPGPGVTYLDESANGRTITVAQGEVVEVHLECTWLAPQGAGPLFRERAAKGWGVFRVALQGGTDITVQSDEACFHDRVVCARPSRTWRVTLQIVRTREPCVGADLTAPASVSVGGTVTVRGNATAGSRVEVWFRRRGETAFTLRRVLTADANGLFTTSYVATDDERYFARVASCQSALELTVVNPVVTGPGSVPRGSTVTLTARGIPHAAVRIAFRQDRPGATYTYRRFGRFSDRGTYTTTYLASDTYWYFAVQGNDSGQRASGERRTVVR